MQVQIQKWGNSLGLRIPMAFAQEVHVKQGSVVDLKLDGKKLVIEPKSCIKRTLKSLLKGITRKNLHEEFQAGPIQGREVW